uniref:Uncharacterized protein AlNc14C49G3878 n=1 Tax=Albugo laibachii Nc14 TaxID=890382 RepID=F0WB22_9STRA|nr:conserved hypothetical protein [Albugo laibachii Nc14]|eukprot:CCA18345.1 conserved hypothetical protein [Albugo laibachii Nc14]
MALIVNPKDITALHLTHKNCKKKLFVYPGISVEELQECIITIFNLSEQQAPCALRDENTRIIFPLCVVSAFPTRFQASNITTEAPWMEVLLAEEFSTLKAHTPEEKPQILKWKDVDLSDFDLALIANVMSQACSAAEMDLHTFERAVDKLLSESGRYDPVVREMFYRIFEMFDRKGTGKADSKALITGLSVFTGGDRDEKIRVLFDVYDTMQKGGLTINELIHLITSTVDITDVIMPLRLDTIRMTSAELAHLTAAECFKQNHCMITGTLSFQNFQKWYMNFNPAKVVADKIDSVHRGPVTDDLREYLNLDSSDVDELLEVFSRYYTTDSEMLRGLDACEVRPKRLVTREDFKNGFQRFLATRKEGSTTQIAQELDITFDQIDHHGNNYVTLTELGACLRDLSLDRTITSVFQLMDDDRDGYITQEDMWNHLTFVFRIAQQALASSAAHVWKNAFDPKSTASYITKNAFDRYRTQNERLSFPEFQQWFGNVVQTFLPDTLPPGERQNTMERISQPEHTAYATDYEQENVSSNQEEVVVSCINRLAALTTLQSRQAAEVFEVVAAKVNEEGVLSRAAFHQAFVELMQMKNSVPNDQVRALLDQIFSEFDTDQDEMVDFCELASGLSVLCSGSEHEKIQAVFTLFDIQQDGLIAREEMETYFASVFRMVYGVVPELAEVLEVTCEELALATVDEAFQAAQLSQDGRLSFQEIKKWYMSRPSQGAIFLPHRKLVDRNTGEQSNSPSNAETPESKLMRSVSMSEKALQEMKEELNLDSFDVNDVLEFFKLSAKDQQLDRQVFLQCFNKLLSTSKCGVGHPIVSSRLKEDTNQANVPSRPMKKDIKQLLTELFDLFDTDENGVIDVVELAAGISILCGGSLEQRSQSLFTLYDRDQDGYISQDEMVSYLTAVFKVMYKADPALDQYLGNSAEELAIATTKECFCEFDRNGDHQLSLEEFTQWIALQRDRASMLKSSRRKHGALVTSEREAIPLDYVERLLGLNHTNFQQVYDLLTTKTERNGFLSPTNLRECVKELIQRFTYAVSEQIKVDDIVDRISAAYGPGKVHFRGVLAGMTAFMHSLDQAEAAFSAFSDQNGSMSLGAMEEYLMNALLLVDAMDPTHLKGLKLSAPDLASILAYAIGTSEHEETGYEISIIAFKKWFVAPKKAFLRKLSAPFSLEEVRMLTNMQTFDVVDVFERFAEQADAQNRLTRDSFHQCMDTFIQLARSLSILQQARAKIITTRLFHVFKPDEYETIDFSELSSGLSVLCKGAQDAKLKAAFRLYDFNGDGFLSMGEMTRYLSSIFRVLYEIQPDMKSNTCVSPEELAVITAEQAFLQVKGDQQCQLTYENFLQWYTAPSHQLGGAVPPSKALTSVRDIQTIMGFERYDPGHLFLLLASFARDSQLCRSALLEAFNDLGKDQRLDYESMIDTLFDVFDSETDSIDFADFCSGISVICGGSREDKMNAALTLFDDGERRISLGNLTRYLSAVYKVLYRVSDERKIGISPADLGRITAEQAFSDAQVDPNANLGIEVFMNWYLDSGKPIYQELPCEPVAFLSGFLDKASVCTENGNLTRIDMEECVQALLGSKISKELIYDRILELFALFDVDGAGCVAWSEYRQALMITCGGIFENTVDEAFGRFDFSQDGVISSEGMVQYLISVFNVLKDAFPPGAMPLEFRDGNESIDALATRSTMRAFEYVNVDGDSVLSPPEFSIWYAQAWAGCMERLIDNGAPKWLIAREVGRLISADRQNILTFFQKQDGPVDKAVFSETLCLLASSSTINGAEDRVRAQTDDLFTFFDRDEDQLLDEMELERGVSLLCGRKNEEKLKTAFQLYDLNNDGFISLSEMRFFLTCVFEVFFELNPNVEAKMGVSPSQLGTRTAAEALREADLDQDRKLSYQEFRIWYTQPCSMNSDENDLKPDSISLQLVRELTQLERYAPESVFEVFAERCDTNDGTLTREAFTECFRSLVECGEDGDSDDRLEGIIDRLFDIFDANGNGVVDFCELSSGISILCGGSREEKIRATFALYDLNQDGLIALDEMTRYLTGVFRVLFETSPETRESLGISPQELALVTAEQCFAEADLDHDGKLTFEEFVQWYTHSSPALIREQSAIQARSSAGYPGVESEPWSYALHLIVDTLQGRRMEVQNCLQLNRFNVKDLLEVFFDESPSGELTFASFKKCFLQLEKLSESQSALDEDEKVRRLFRVFDHNQANEITFREFGSGISAFAASSTDEKIQAAFSLWGSDDGLTMDTFSACMASMLRVLYILSDDKQMSALMEEMTADDVAQSIAKECFQVLEIDVDGTISAELFKEVRSPPLILRSKYD